MVENAKREKGPFEYLFLDIEWNQAPGTSGLDGREAIQIGVVAADAQIQKVKTFSKAIRLSDPKVFNEETEIISHSTIAHVMRGNEEKAVLEKFAQSFPQYCHLIVWRRDAYDLFLRDMRKNGVMIKRHKAVVLQDVLGVIAGNSNNPIGFEKALICSGIKYVPNYLHYAKHDANYLYQLFYQCFQQYSSMIAKEESCFANVATKMLHTEDCRYVQSLSAERKVEVPKSIIFSGYTVCKCCGKKENWKRLEWELSRTQKTKNKNYRDDLKQLPLTETNIEKICKWFKLSYSVSSNAVFVRTAFSRWIVYLREDKVKELFHENYRANKSQYFNKQKMKCTEGYHKQKLPSESFFEVIQYIKYHDAGTVKRMVKKSRLEKLLEMVEMELKMKNMEEKEYGYDNMPELRRTNIR